MIARIAFRHEVPSPSAPSFARTHWLQSFAATDYEITRDGELVSLRCKVTGRTLYYPLASVAAFELASPHVPGPSLQKPQTTPVVLGTQKGKRGIT